MEHIKFFVDIGKNDVAVAGGKGASLGEMTRAGIAVPPGFVVTAGAFDRFVTETHLDEEILARLREVNPADTNSVDRVSNVLRDVIHDTRMPPDLTIDIFRAFDTLNAELVAVRSSATAEDSSIASWAGELETYLNTTRDSVVDKVKICWSSLFTPRALFYRHEKNLIGHYVSVAVVIQKMVQSEVSGIAFTVHPVTEDRDQMIIEAGWGLGEAIVGGQITPDSYIVSKSQMAILDINIGSQTRKLMKTIKHENNKTTESSANEWVELSAAESERQKLTGRQIMVVAAACKKIEAHYGFPCDIEWAMTAGELFITQSRPITTLKNK
ncbi:MAG: hypothetical protein HY984_00420 [Candidatus Magasanikbacteria bacterium]|nr:hypothetical protein [Candidatus Magasanikbacteria bacterium]